MSKRIFHIQKLGFSVSLILFAFVITPQSAIGQTTAGNATYNFLELPYSAKASSLGGINISSMGEDLGLAMYNPSLMRANMDGQLHLSIKPFYAGIQQYDVSGVNIWEKHQIALGWGIHYMDYGNISMTDYAGNDLGTMHPNDYAVQFSASKDYIENFRIGAALKFIHSNYGMYKSSGIAMDIGLTFLAPNKLSQASILVKNIGTQLSSIGNKQELPFNLILGFSKKLAYAPIQFSVTADRVSVWNNLYYDPIYANLKGDAAPSHLQNLFNHLILASELYIGDQVDFNLGYNFIRRYDLNVQNQANGMNGFSTGLGLRLDRMHLQYGTAFFQRNMYHHFSVTYKLKK
jgi:hypothetical protein